MFSELGSSKTIPEPLKNKESLDDSVRVVSESENDKKELPKIARHFQPKIHHQKVSVLDLVNANRYGAAMEAILANLESRDNDEAFRQCREIQHRLDFEFQNDVDYSNTQVCPYSPSVLQGCCPGYLEEFTPLRIKADGNCLYGSVCIALQVSFFQIYLLNKEK